MQPSRSSASPLATWLASGSPSGQAPPGSDPEMAFICPILASGGPAAPLHAAVHLGLTAFIVAAGTVSLGFGIAVFRRTAPAGSSEPPIPERSAPAASAD